MNQTKLHITICTPRSENSSKGCKPNKKGKVGG